MDSPADGLANGSTERFLGSRTRRVGLADSSRSTTFGTRSRGDVRHSYEERSAAKQRTQGEAKACRRTVGARRSMVTLSVVFILPFHRSPLMRSSFVLSSLFLPSHLCSVLGCIHTGITLLSSFLSRTEGVGFMWVGARGRVF